MEKNLNIIPAVLHLKEASSLLEYENSEISDILLQLSKELLIQYKLDNNDILSSENILNSISLDVKNEK
jgi:hypothetical protein